MNELEQNPGGSGAPPHRENAEVARVRAILAQRPADWGPGWAIFEIDREPWLEIQTDDDDNAEAARLGLPTVTDDEVALLPEAQRALAIELDEDPEENPRPHRNPEMTREEAFRAFNELLRDPDPAAMQIAEDLVLEHKLSLADLGEGGVFERRRSMHRSVGRFTLSPLYPADAPLYAIEWQLEERPGHVTNAPHTTWTYWITAFWNSEQRVVRSGAWGYYRTFEEARRAAAADSWALAKRMKQMMVESWRWQRIGQVEFVLQDTLRSPDATAPELYEHRATRGPKGGRPKQPTYKEAQDAIFSALRRAGWVLSPLTLKLPHATSPNGSLRLWFKPQAVHYTSTYTSGGWATHDRHVASNARSISYDLDIRKMTPSEFLGYLRDRFPKAFE